MTALRFRQLKDGQLPISEQEKEEFKSQLRHEQRSDAAYRAVITKRKKYKQWPTRQRKSTFIDGAGI